MKKFLFIFISIFIIIIPVLSAPFQKETCNLGWEHVHHDHNEESYQQAWCSAHNGIMEYKNKDFTRVDCLTDVYAVEFDFANKWHESIGQALHYGVMTGKKPKIILILDDIKSQKVYYWRVKNIAKKYDFDVEYLTNKILKLNKKGECFNPNCKCHY